MNNAPFKPAYKPKKGELAISGRLVVLVTYGYGNTSYGSSVFSGVVIVPDENWPVGMYSRTWEKLAFKKFNGHIQLVPDVKEIKELVN